MVKNLAANAGDVRDSDLIPGSGRSPGGGLGNPLQYSCLENPHGQRSLAGQSPEGHKESDTTEATGHTLIEVYYYKILVPYSFTPESVFHVFKKLCNYHHHQF